MARVPKIAPGGTNLLVRVLDVNRALIPDVFIEVVGKRGSINENPNAVNPADGVRFRGEKAWGFEDSEFDGAASMTLTIRAFKAVPPFKVKKGRHLCSIGGDRRFATNRFVDYVVRLQSARLKARCQTEDRGNCCANFHPNPFACSHEGKPNDFALDPKRSRSDGCRRWGTP